MQRGSREALGIFITGVGGIAFLAGISPLVNLLIGPIGILFALVTVAGAVLFVLSTLSIGASMMRGVLILTALGIFSFGCMYGPMWYFISYLPSLGSSAFEFKLQEIGTPGPTRIYLPSAIPRAPTGQLPTATKRP